MLYPLKFNPIHMERIWGGDRLRKRFGRLSISEGKLIGESWEIACHPNAMSIVSNGPLAGTALQELIDRYGRELLGDLSHDRFGNSFPLLIKFLDAVDRLSVQVHPDDAYAERHENGEMGKTEMWYILDAEPGAELIAGVKEGVDPEDFRRAVEDGSVGDLLNHVPVAKGDTLFIPAGMAHAILEGILIVEIQQNSDTTYRLFDWNRLGSDGKPRELHIDKAMDVLDFKLRPEIDIETPAFREGDSEVRVLAACNYFASEEVALKGQVEYLLDGSKFVTMTVVEGEGRATAGGEAVDFKAGESIMLPASLGNCVIEGRTKYIKAYLPDIEEDIVKRLKDKGIPMETIRRIPGLF